MIGMQLSLLFLLFACLMHVNIMKSLIREIRYWLVSVFIKWILVICPNCRFKDLFSEFLKDNLQYMIDDITDEFLNKGTCEHPIRKREGYREGVYKCWECGKIIFED